MRNTSVALAFILAACAAPGVDDFDPAEIRGITPTEAASKCIGDVSTPLCAVETFLACMWRLERPLCERVGVFDFSLADRPDPVRYRILSARILRAEDIPDHLRDTDWMKPGYADITLLYVDRKEIHCRPEGCLADFSLKPTPIGWQVIGWAVQGVD